VISLFWRRVGVDLDASLTPPGQPLRVRD